jgi:hypothetical protein
MDSRVGLDGDLGNSPTKTIKEKFPNMPSYLSELSSNMGR